MPLDDFQNSVKGGILYSIQTAADLSKLQEFIASVNKAKDSMAELRKITQGRSIISLKVNPISEGTISRLKRLDSQLLALNPSLDETAASAEEVAEAMDKVAKAPNTPAPPKPDRKPIIDFWSKIKNVMTGFDRSVNRTSFSFRRLFVTMATYAATRRLFGGFLTMVQQMLTFNGMLEQAQLGIASLLLATGQVRNAFGQTVDVGSQLPLALKEASRQMGELRKVSLTTAATYQELLDAFQTAIAPGFTAGLNLDEIREVSVRISQAASALGVAQNQLAEEIRSLVQGTITPRNTRIATALGITNDDIKRAREAGKLFEFLRERFKAFQISADATSKTFNALFKNFTGSVLLALAEGGTSFFDTVKEWLTELQGLFTQTDAITGQLKPSPDAVRMFKQIGDAFKDIVNNLREISKESGLRDLFASGQDLAPVLRTSGIALAQMIRGGLLGISNLRKAVTLLVESIKSIPLISAFFDEKSLKEAITLFAQITIVVVGAKIAFAALFSVLSMATFGGLIVSLAAVKTGLINANMALAAFVGYMMGVKLAAFAATLMGAATAAKVLLVSLTGIAAAISAIMSFRLGNYIYNALSGKQKAIVATFLLPLEILVANMDNLFRIATTRIKPIAEAAINSIFAWLKKKLTQDFSALFEYMSQILQKSNVGWISSLGKSFANTAKSWLDASNAINMDEVEKSWNDLILHFKEIGESFITVSQAPFQHVRDLWNEKPKEKTSFFADVLKQFKEDMASVKGIVDDATTFITDKSKGAGEETKTLAVSLKDVFNSLKGVIAGNAASLAELSNELQKIEDQAKSAQRQLTSSKATIGLPNNIITVIKEQLKAKDEIEDATKNINTDLNNLEKAMDSLSKRKAAADSKITSFSPDDQRRIEDAIAKFKEYINVVAEGKALEKEFALSQLELDAARSKGDKKAIEDAQKHVDEVSKQLETTTGRYKQLLSILDNTKGEYENIKDIIVELVQIEGQQLATSENINTLLETRARLEREINAVRSMRIQQIAIEEAQRIQTSNRNLLTETLYAVALERTKDAATKNNLLAQKDVELAMIQLEEQQKITQQLQQQREAALANATTEDERLALTDLYEEATTESFLKEQEQTAKLNQLREQASIKQLAMTNPIKAGIIEVGNQLREEFTGTQVYFNLTLDLIRNSVQSLGDFIGTTIVDAFDPSKDQTIIERFRSFLQGLAQMILSTLAQVAIVRILFGEVAGAGLLGGVGMNKGGSVKGVGMAEGGPVKRAPFSYRPRGLSPKDTAGPVWLDPREWVIPGSSVAKYGSAVMHYLQHGLFDAGDLKRLVANRSMGLSSRRSLGMAAGGSVSSSVTRTVPSSVSSSNTPVVQPAIVASETTMQSLLTGGRQSMLDFLNRNGYAPAT